MEGDECSFPPDSSDDHSQRGSVASSATLSRAQDVLIYLFGDSAVHLTVEGLSSVTVQELGRSVREALNIPESVQDAFAFWLCSPLLELQLKVRHQPYKLCRQWQDLLYRFTEASEEDISQDEPYLQYRRNVFYPKSKELQVLLHISILHKNILDHVDTIIDHLVLRILRNKMLSGSCMNRICSCLKIHQTSVVIMDLTVNQNY
ncbi:hypothetical protein INR49_015730 [Caranx melampygus]|nr:hypothetical protein INR49_015730 [Caranx melampygus]